VPLRGVGVAAAAGVAAAGHPVGDGAGQREIHGGQAGGDLGGNGRGAGRALEFYDRWLPGTMRRIDSITRACIPQCVMLRRSW
jgi:hypothetical protein